MLNKIIIISSALFTIFLVLMSFFPGKFTNKLPNEQYLPYLPPNDGLNQLRIYNDTDSYILIDSLTLAIKPDRLKVLEHTVIQSGEIKNVTFLFDGFSTSMNDNISIRLYGSSTQQVIEISFNKMDELYKLWDIGKYYEGCVQNIEYNKNWLYADIDKRIVSKSFFGTDNNGQDIWAKLVYGTRIIIQILFYSLMISVPIGIITGLLRGYYTNFISDFLNLISGFANSISIYLLTMLVLLLFQHKIIYIVIAFSLVQWVEIEKLIYERVKTLKESNFIKSARLFGKSNLNIIFSEILILCLPQIIIGTIFLAKRIILIETGLSFLGYSVTIPYTSWGAIIAGMKDQIYFSSSLGIIIPPVIMIVLTLISFNNIENYLKRSIRNA